MQKQIAKNGDSKGITLIALVITIIVLLILAGVTISMVLGDDGIIAQAQGAKTAQEKAIFDDVYNQYLAEEEVKEKGGEVDEKLVLEKTVRALGEENGFDITEDEEGNIISIEYKGNDNKIKELINSELNYNDLRDAGYIVTTIKGKPYVSGITTRVPEELKAKIEPYGYTYEPVSSTNTNIATGDILRKIGQEDITIIVKGDVTQDGIENISDITDILTYIEKSGDNNYTELQILAMDVNGDSKISRLDSSIISKYLVEKITFENFQLTDVKEITEVINYTSYTSDDIIELLSTQYTFKGTSRIYIDSGTTILQFEESVIDLLKDIGGNITFESYADDETDPNWDNNLTGTDNPIGEGYYLYIYRAAVDTETENSLAISLQLKVILNAE